MELDLSPIFDALSANPGAIAAWEVDSPTDPTLSVFDVSGPPRQLAYLSVATPDEAEVSRRLDAAGHPTGYYALGTGVVWRNQQALFEIWTEYGAGLVATAAGLALRDGTLINRADIEAVVPFAVSDDVVRGVTLKLRMGEHTLAQAFKHSAAYLVDFSDGKGWSWITWVSVLAHELARWLDVPLTPEA